MAFRRGEESENAYLGALIIAEGINTVHSLTKAYFKVHSGKKK